MARTREDILFDLEVARNQEESAQDACVAAEVYFHDAEFRLFVASEAVESLEEELDEFDSFDEMDESMDGDAASALASAGFGTDEDYEHNDIDDAYEYFEEPSEVFDYPEMDE